MSRIKKWKIQSIKMKLMISFMIPILLIVLLGVVSYGRSSKEMSSKYETSTLTSLTIASSYFDVVLKNLSNKSEELLADDATIKYFSGYYSGDVVEEYQKSSEITKRVTATADTNDFIHDIYIFSNYGRCISSNTSDSLQNLYTDFEQSSEGTEYLALNQESSYLPYHSFLEEKTVTTEEDYSLSFIQSFNNSKNERTGYVLIELRKDSVVDILSKLDLGAESITGFIIGENREIINEPEEKSVSFTAQEFYQNALVGSEKSGYEYVRLEEEKYLFTYSRIAETDMMLCSLIPEATILEQSSNVRNVTVVIVVFAVIIALFIGSVISMNISRTLRCANRTLEEAENGNLTVEMKIKRKDEFAVLADCITKMILRLKHIIVKMTRISSTVTDSAGKVSDNSKLLLNATKDIHMSVNDIEQGILHQSADAENCLHQMEDLADQIGRVYKNTEEIRTITKDTKSIIDEGIVIVADLNTKSKNTSKITNSIIEGMGELKEESDDIRSIVDTMNELSSQTNLLSLNASIEAARAGEAGKGFAVVAEEIRKLANLSSEAANKIGDIIQHIAEKMEQTVITARQAGVIVDTQEQALLSTIDVFKEINAHAENLIYHTDLVYSGLSKIESDKNDTLGAIESISAASEETAAASINLSETAENQVNAVENLSQVALSLQEETLNLEETIKIFIV